MTTDKHILYAERVLLKDRICDICDRIRSERRRDWVPVYLLDKLNDALTELDILNSKLYNPNED